MELERGLRPRQVLDGRVPRAGRDVVQHQMPLAEGAALGILAGEPDRDPSTSSDANASASACAHSRPPPSATAFWRRSSWRKSFGWTVKPSGQAYSCASRTASISRSPRVPGSHSPVVAGASSAPPPPARSCRSSRSRFLIAWTGWLSPPAGPSPGGRTPPAPPPRHPPAGSLPGPRASWPHCSRTSAAPRCART